MRKGSTHTEAAKEAIRQKIRERVQNPTPAMIAGWEKTGDRHRGKTIPAATRKKMSDAAKGVPKSAEHVEAIMAAKRRKKDPTN